MKNFWPDFALRVMRKLPLLVAASMAIGGQLWSAPMVVANHSFETFNPLNSNCGTACNFTEDEIPSWTSAGGSKGSFQPGPPTNTTYFNSIPDGVTIAYSNGPSISQTVGETVLLGLSYTLQVEVGKRNDQFPNLSVVELVIGDLLTGTVVTASGAAAPRGG